MFTHKLGAIELPRPQNIKIEENPKLFAIYGILYHKIKTIPSFCILSNAERIICVRKCIFDEILSKCRLFKNNFGSLGSNFKTTSLVGRLNSDHNLESNY